MRTSLALALAALCLAGCAAAPPAATAPAAAAAPAAGDKAAPQTVASADDPNKLICQTEEAATGTHIRRPIRVCATAEEWERRREASQKAMRDHNRRAGQSAPKSN